MAPLLAMANTIRLQLWSSHLWVSKTPWRQPRKTMTTNQWQRGISAIFSYNKTNESEPPQHEKVDMEVTTTEDKATNNQGNNYGQQNLDQVPRNMFHL